MRNHLIVGGDPTQRAETALELVAAGADAVMVWSAGPVGHTTVHPLAVLADWSSFGADEALIAMLAATRRIVDARYDDTAGKAGPLWVLLIDPALGDDPTSIDDLETVTADGPQVAVGAIVTTNSASDLPEGIRETFTIHHL
ncbi:hypothetical protein GCM10012275_42830 [Longimycelium tulufanense]|uniref:Uncharacterized protein n=1 Tax=Longimycelium tulufanense TaxID=907463 RepID=A0A8J3FWM6_9PSEU|nr:hypothetical protein [Longimycelium tulufanense]GGM67675.1 hypothetical protein GCM10012275_42830 [Longimycelium tulufanense]